MIDTSANDRERRARAAAAAEARRDNRPESQYRIQINNTTAGDRTTDSSSRFCATRKSIAHQRGVSWNLDGTFVYGEDLGFPFRDAREKTPATMDMRLVSADKRSATMGRVGESPSKRHKQQDDARKLAAEQNEADEEDHREKTMECMQSWGYHETTYRLPNINRGGFDLVAPEYDLCDPRQIFRDEHFDTITDQQLADVAMKFLMEQHRDRDVCVQLLQKSLPWAGKQGAQHERTVAWGMITVLHFSLLILKKSLTDDMKATDLFSKTTRPSVSLKAEKKTCFSWLVQTILMDPFMKKSQYGLLTKYMNVKSKERHDLYFKVIMPLVRGVCQFWSPQEGEWTVEDITDVANGFNFRSDALKKIAAGVWSIEEVNSRDHSSWSNAEWKAAMSGLWYEFAVICMYCMHDFPSKIKNTDHTKWVVTRHQASSAYWSDLEVNRLFRNGGTILQRLGETARHFGSLFTRTRAHEYVQDAGVDTIHLTGRIRDLDLDEQKEFDA